MGSAGSSKSYFITQKLILKALKSKRKVLVARRYGSTIRNSTFALFKIVIDSFQLTPHCKIRESDFYIQLPNGSEIIFMGLDDEQKLLSIADISDIFIEEVFECNKEIIDQLNLRMRGKAEKQQIIMAFNPISKNHWLYDFCEHNHPSSFKFIHSTYKDNPFLSADYVNTLEEMAVLNPQKYRIYGLGEWGVDAEGLVYQNFSVQHFDPQEMAARGYVHRVGMDLGWIDPSTVVCTLYDEANKIIYVYRDWYKSGATLEDIVNTLDYMQLRKTLIYCDSADPRAIAFFKKAGFRVEGSKKGAGSVEVGIAFLQNHKLVIHPDCRDLIREIENYSYIKDKNTNSYTNKTTHEYSHALDGLRYAYSDLYTQYKMGTMNKQMLGL